MKAQVHSMENIIKVTNLVKEYKINAKQKGLMGSLKAVMKPEYRIVKAVDDISFEIRKGEIVGYLGPNGAGKSTTIKMLSGVLQPTSGTVLINGRSPQKNRKDLAYSIGVVFGQRSQLEWDLRLGESFELLRYIYDVPKKDFTYIMDWLNETLKLYELMDVPVRQLSLGQRMRGEFAASLIHSPEILFLDEPTIGLDIEAKHSIRDFILQLNKEKQTTIILTTHDLIDVKKLCQRIIVINHGHIIEDGSIDAIYDRLSSYRHLVIDCPNFPEDFNYSKTEVIKKEGSKVWLRFSQHDSNITGIINDLSGFLDIKDISIEETELEEVIKEIYKQV